MTRRISLTATEVFALFKTAGGYQYGPHTETYAIREVDWPKFVAAIAKATSPVSLETVSSDGEVQRSGTTAHNVRPQATVAGDGE